MRKIAWWFWLSGKRLLKKPFYLILLVLMIVLTLCYHTEAEESSGMVTVALAVPEETDLLVPQIMEQLDSESGWILYTQTTAEEARLLVTAGKADAAWIFPKDVSEKLAVFLDDRTSPVVEVVQREETVLLRLSRERLSGALYGCCAQPLYLQYLRQHVPQLDNLTDGQLAKYMEWFRGNDRLFALQWPDGTTAHTADYLHSPLRGLFGILLQMCALAAAMYFMQDQKSGLFQRFPISAMAAVELGSQLSALWGMGLTAMLCLAVCGMWVSAWREIVVTVLYLLCCAGFAMLLRRICGKIPVLAGLLPVLTVAMLVVCPVFVEIPQLQPLQYLLPPTYYMQAVSSDRFLLLLIVYTAVCFLGCIPLRRHRV